MTDEQIIKALICYSDTEDVLCKDCAYQSEAKCGRAMAKDALDLINRQAEKIADLTDNLLCEKETNKHLCDEYCRQMKQDSLNANYVFDKYRDEIIRQAKAEAIKEFAEKVKQNFADMEFDRTVSTRKTYRAEEVAAYTDGIFHQLIPNELDELVKEMTEENFGNK